MVLNFFCDIDGTLLPFGKGLPESTRLSIEKAQKYGHRFFLATGRSLKEVDERLGVIAFDGGVYSNGVKAVLRDKTILDVTLSDLDEDFLLDWGEENGFLIMVQSDDGTYMSRECLDFFIYSMKKHLGRIIDVPNIIVCDKRRDYGRVRKMLFLSPSHNMKKVRAELSSRFQIVDNTVGIPQSDMAEICLKGYNKGTGISSVMAALGEDIASSVAIGDGANDEEMLSTAGLGIAMGNAGSEIKRHAGWVTDTVDNDGFSKAVEYAIRTMVK